MTPQQLKACTGCATLTMAESWHPHITEAMRAYGIDSPLRQAAFLAQIGHESGGLRYRSELWGPTPAQARYEGREDLGNTQPGDGKRFKGHGLIQATGRYNHARLRDRLRARFPNRGVPDFEADPESLAWPEWAALSAADFWDDHNLNAWADKEDFDGVSDIINRGRKTPRLGDANGYADRLRLYNLARKALL